MEHWSEASDPSMKHCRGGDNGSMTYHEMLHASIWEVCLQTGRACLEARGCNSKIAGARI